SENSPLWDKTFKQVVNISAASVSSWNENTGFGPIGNNTIQFTGKYDGNGYIIDSLSINRSDSSHQGFFGKTNGCTLVKLRLTNVSITGNDNTGGLVGENVASSISEGFTNGKITGSESVGGLIGKNLSSSIKQSSSSAEVAGGSYTGGLVGSNDSSPINGCRSDAEVTGTVYTGVLVGYSYASTITHSYAYGNVHAGPRTGGLVGYADISIITCSYNSSTVVGADAVGGLVGETYHSDINNSYNKGSVQGTAAVGGLIGNDLSSGINNCYSSSFVSGDSYIGGIIGVGDAANCFWDKTINSTLDNSAGIGITTNEMKSHSTYLNAGWDPGIWCINENYNDGYPFLFWQNNLGAPLPVITEDKFADQVPKEFNLMQNSPNPFNPDTRIEFYISNAAMVTLKVYDILGSEIAVLVNDERTPGRYTAYWNGKNNYGQTVSSGVYLYRITAGNYIETRKMNLVK
ncbi:MAG: T9SS type A sorting domain-containing protein, partial [Ignavibacteriaceae bacterium]